MSVQETNSIRRPFISRSNYGPQPLSVWGWGASHCQHKGCQRLRLSASAWDSRGDNQRGLAAMTLINGPEVSYPPAEVTAPTFLPVINCRWFHNVCCSFVISCTKRPSRFWLRFATERIHKLQLVDCSALRLQLNFFTKYLTRITSLVIRELQKCNLILWNLFKNKQIL